MSIAESILDIVRQELATHHCEKLTHVKVCYGALSQVVPDSLSFCFDALVKNTPHEHARFELEEVPLVLACSACKKQFQPVDVITPCPACGQYIGHEVISGKELYVAHLEAE